LRSGEAILFLAILTRLTTLPFVILMQAKRDGRMTGRAAAAEQSGAWDG
jgi:hypothetical protein